MLTGNLRVPQKVVLHLGSSLFFGGPERWILGLAQNLPAEYRSLFLSFREGGRCQAWMDRACAHGFEAHALKNDTPWILGAIAELTAFLRKVQADVVCTHGYKADLVGLIAARRVGIPIVAVSHGWTWESFKVRCYEALDRIILRKMDRVICVSQGQAAKVRRAGVPEHKIVVIHNAIDAVRFDCPDPAGRADLEHLFPGPVRWIIGAAGRLSPEKGFSDLVEAAALVAQADRHIGFVLFGDGLLRAALERQIAARDLGSNFVLPGFRSDIDRFLPHLDLFVLPSYTEGLPTVILEAFAAGVPVVATAVGGTPEAVEDAVNGYLVPPGDPPALAQRILDARATN